MTQRKSRCKRLRCKSEADDRRLALYVAWFRKLENRSGRWTSPDPYNGSANLASGQSWNRYAYVENDPVNFADPSGLLEEIIIQTWAPRWTWWDSMWASYWGAQNGWESGDTGRRGPLEIDSGGGGDTGAPRPPVADKDAWDKCIKDVAKHFSKPPGTQEQLNTYNTQLRQAAEAYQLQLKHHGETRNRSTYWVYAGMLAGGLIGTLVEPGGGTVAGALAGGAIAVGQNVDLSNLSATQAKEAYDMTRRHIRENNPEAVARQNYFDRKRAAESECDKLLPKPWWNNGRSSRPLFN